MTAAPPDPVVNLPLHALAMAIQQAVDAEQWLADEVAKAEAERDGLFRRLGVLQDRLDEFRRDVANSTRHVRDLRAALPMNQQ